MSAYALYSTFFCPAGLDAFPTIALRAELVPPLRRLESERLRAPVICLRGEKR